jgi:hypothetical protein
MLFALCQRCLDLRVFVPSYCENAALPAIAVARDVAKLRHHMRMRLEKEI